jgi:hypothetical protein
MRLRTPAFALLLATSATLFSQASAPNTLTPQEKSRGWKLLFDGKTPSGWHAFESSAFPSAGWQVRDGLLSVTEDNHGVGGQAGDLLSAHSYANFELSVDFLLTPGCNSGIKYFVNAAAAPGHQDHPQPIGFEYQLLDDDRHPDARLGRNGDRTVGSLYDLIPAAQNKPIHPIGQWNTARIVVRGTHGEHWLNGVRILDYDRASPEFKAAVAASKFHVYPGFGQASSGFLLLQDHGAPASFRNLKIRELPPTP